MYYKLTLKNSAVCFVSLKSNKCIIDSLSFYQPLSLKGKIYKFFMGSYFILLRNLGFIKSRNLLSEGDIIKFLISLSFDVQSSDVCSYPMFLSSCGHKLIIKERNNTYRKFGIYDAQHPCINEIKAYVIMNDRISNFVASSISDISISSNIVSFRMSMEQESSYKNDSFYEYKAINRSLIELFNLSRDDSRILLSTIEKLSMKLSELNLQRDFYENIKSYLESLSVTKINVPLGFVHNDFKIWNIKSCNGKIHIFDFESSYASGLPFIDLINYYIDPLIVKGNSVINIIRFLQCDRFSKILDDYSSRLNACSDISLMIILSLVCRFIYHFENGNEYSALIYSGVISGLLMDY
ncbi:hypothetical protein [Endozoicomonas elysicola]|uniref:Aminoglycoside phosphotransferase domain-containing protein n=1 Tax=Endozoicomonas elysicola TaxID=305900 RepID=A0A081K9D2_9GAMM|nr:hypothetical protein [Endozoicomonas elysicola]KEI70758.1 hypothetical protein GV64_08385 [Endozoicomonas elysicola]